MMGLFIDEIFALTTCQTNCLAGEINGTARIFQQKNKITKLRKIFLMRAHVTFSNFSYSNCYFFFFIYNKKIQSSRDVLSYARC